MLFPYFFVNAESLYSRFVSGWETPIAFQGRFSASLPPTVGGLELTIIFEYAERLNAFLGLIPIFRAAAIRFGPAFMGTQWR